MEDALDTALRGFCFGVTETKAFTGAAILWDNFMWVFKVLYSPKLFWPRWKTRVFVMTEPWCNLLYQYQRKNIHGLCKKNKLGASFGVVVVVVLFLEGSQTDVIICYYPKSYGAPLTSTPALNSLFCLKKVPLLIGGCPFNTGWRIIWEWHCFANISLHSLPYAKK